MNQGPETRASLLVRLKDRADQAAWYEFAEIYRPVIVRLACRKGMQAADAGKRGGDPPIRLESSAKLPNGGKFSVLLPCDGVAEH